VIETAPGEEAQVDYGTGPMVRDPQTGKYRCMRLYVMTLGHSRKAVRLLVFRSSTQIWAELHETALTPHIWRSQRNYAANSPSWRLCAHAGCFRFADKDRIPPGRGALTK